MKNTKKRRHITKAPAPTSNTNTKHKHQIIEPTRKLTIFKSSENETFSSILYRLYTINYIDSFHNIADELLFIVNISCFRIINKIYCYNLNIYSYFSSHIKVLLFYCRNLNDILFYFGINYSQCKTLILLMRIESNEKLMKWKLLFRRFHFENNSILKARHKTIFVYILNELSRQIFKNNHLYKTMQRNIFSKRINTEPIYILYTRVSYCFDLVNRYKNTK